MTSFELSKTIVRILDKKKADDIRLLRTRDVTILADYFVIAGGSSTTQVKSLVDEVDFQLSEMGLQPSFIEGYQSNNWIVLDYHDVIVHIFLKDTRNYYELERVWTDAENVDISDIIAEGKE